MYSLNVKPCCSAIVRSYYILCRLQDLAITVKYNYIYILFCFLFFFHFSALWRNFNKAQGNYFVFRLPWAIWQQFELYMENYCAGGSRHSSKITKYFETYVTFALVWWQENTLLTSVKWYLSLPTFYVPPCGQWQLTNVHECKLGIRCKNKHIPNLYVLKV